MLQQTVFVRQKQFYAAVHEIFSSTVFEKCASGLSKTLSIFATPRTFIRSKGFSKWDSKIEQILLTEKRKWIWAWILQSLKLIFAYIDKSL